MLTTGVLVQPPPRAAGVEERQPEDRLQAIAAAGGIVPLVGMVTNGALSSKLRVYLAEVSVAQSCE